MRSTLATSCLALLLGSACGSEPIVDTRPRNGAGQLDPTCPSDFGKMRYDYCRFDAPCADAGQTCWYPGAGDCKGDGYCSPGLGACADSRPEILPDGTSAWDGGFVWRCAQ